MLNINLQVAGMVLCLVGVLQVLVGPKRWSGSVAFYFTLFNYTVAILLNLLLEGEQGEYFHFILLLSNFIEFFSGYFLTFVVIKWFLYCVDPNLEGKEIRLINKIVFALLAVQETLLVVSQFTGFYYRIGSDNKFRDGNGFFVLLIMWIFSCAVAIYALFRYKKQISRCYFLSFLAFAVIAFSSAWLQFYYRDIYFITIASSVSALVLYLLTINDRTEMYLRKERENDRLKTEMMLSQIQPHFIFNSLTAIKHFCRHDPALAEKAVTDFSFFLRGNMDSLNSKAPISFRKELEHTKAYLSLEKYRFGDALTIHYDLKATEFSLPPLTLQPIVENAVCHGIRETQDGRGTVTILTREYDDRFEVVVTDDGAGFYSQADPGSDQPHIGIQNVKYSFNGTGAESVVLSDSLLAVPDYAFTNCPNLKYVTIPESVMLIQPYAFDWDNVTIRCYENSFAHNYAAENNVPFELIKTILLGDADNNGTVNINDVTAVQRSLAELEVFTELQQAGADVNQDGTVDVSDATAIQMYLADYELLYPIGQSLTVYR